MAGLYSFNMAPQHPWELYRLYCLYSTSWDWSHLKCWISKEKFYYEWKIVLHKFNLSSSLINKYENEAHVLSRLGIQDSRVQSLILICEMSISHPVSENCYPKADWNQIFFSISRFDPLNRIRKRLSFFLFWVCLTTQVSAYSISSLRVNGSNPNTV